MKHLTMQFENRRIAQLNMVYEIRDTNVIAVQGRAAPHDVKNNVGAMAMCPQAIFTGLNPVGPRLDPL